MNEAIFVIGKPGSGKTEMVKLLVAFLTEDGFSPDTISDRIGLEEAVLADVGYRGILDSGGLVGTHSKLIADGLPGHRKIHVLDGVLLNRVHEQMVAYMAGEKSSGQVTVAEYAIGPDIDFGKGREPLLQSAHNLVEHLFRFEVFSHVLLIDVETPLVVRSARESRRPDAMASETFQAYFPDGGEMNPADKSRLGSHYYRIDNGYDDIRYFGHEARLAYESFIFPQIRQEGRSPGFVR